MRSSAPAAIVPAITTVWAKRNASGSTPARLPMRRLIAVMRVAPPARAAANA